MALPTESSNFAHCTETTMTVFTLVLSCLIGIVNTAALKLDFQFFSNYSKHHFLEY